MPCRPQKATSSKKHLGPCACACMYSSTPATQSIAFHVLFLFDLEIILVFMAPIKVHYRPSSFPHSVVSYLCCVCRNVWIWHLTFTTISRFSHSVSSQISSLLIYFWLFNSRYTSKKPLSRVKKWAEWMKLYLLVSTTDRVNTTNTIKCQVLIKF